MKIGSCAVIVWLSLDITVDTFVVLKLNYQMQLIELSGIKTCSQFLSVVLCLVLASCNEKIPRHCSTLCAVHENKYNLILFIHVGIAIHKGNVETFIDKCEAKFHSLHCNKLSSHNVNNFSFYFSPIYRQFSIHIS